MASSEGLVGCVGSTASSGGLVSGVGSTAGGFIDSLGSTASSGAFFGGFLTRRIQQMAWLATLGQRDRLGA